VEAGVRPRKSARDDGRSYRWFSVDSHILEGTSQNNKRTLDKKPCVPDAVVVQLIDDDVFEVFGEVDPLRVMGKDASVEHVGVGQDDLSD
jgi:ribosomal protein L35